MCGNSLSTILLIQLAIVHVLAATLQLDYVHLIANLLSGQIGLPGKFKNGANKFMDSYCYFVRINFNLGLYFKEVSKIKYVVNVI